MSRQTVRPISADALPANSFACSERARPSELSTGDGGRATKHTRARRALFPAVLDSLPGAGLAWKEAADNYDSTAF